MSAITTTPRTVTGRLAWLAADGWALTQRNLRHYTRVPELIFFSAIQPIMFVLLFRYVFGGAIQVPGGDYVDFLMPGVFAQTVVFGATATAIGLAEDLGSGAIDRFRSLPMADAAVLVGRTSADLVRGVLTVALMALVGFLVGFRFATGWLPFLAGIGLLIGFGYAVMWGFAIVGLLAPDAETAQLMTFPVLMPLAFASSAFVPTASMPGWLQVFTAHQPVSVVVDASRALMLGGPTAGHVTSAVLWIAGLLAVSAPVAVRVFRRVD